MHSNPFPHLLNLLDDPSPVVAEEVRKALLPMAADITELLRAHPATPGQRRDLNRILIGWRKARLLKAWPDWRQGSEEEALERAHTLLSEFACGWCQNRPLAEALDAEAERVRPRLDGLPLEERQRLLGFALFGEELGGDREDYYAPANSILSEVLERRLGNPISLCSILILVGRRLGLAFVGCGYPGHFLARFRQGEETFYVDAFDSGVIYDDKLSPALRGERALSEVRRLLSEPTPVEQIVERILRNLVAAGGGPIYGLLLKDLEARGRGLGSGQALREPLFLPGQVVRHRSKDFRGVVVDYELYSEEDGGEPHQPLYRILVHGSPHVAATREANLMTDDGLVAHPYLNVFFSHFEDGVYVRNSQPWEG